MHSSAHLFLTTGTQVKSIELPILTSGWLILMTYQNDRLREHIKMSRSWLYRWYFYFKSHSRVRLKGMNLRIRRVCLPTISIKTYLDSDQPNYRIFYIAQNLVMIIITWPIQMWCTSTDSLVSSPRALDIFLDIFLVKVKNVTSWFKADLLKSPPIQNATHI